MVIVIFIIIFVSLKIKFGATSADIIPIVGTFAVASLRIIPSISIISTGLINIQYSQFAIDIINKDLKLLPANKDNIETQKKSISKEKLIKLS